MADARKDKRTLLSLRIRYKSATLEDFIERYSMDISRGGVFIKSKKPLGVGTLLKFEFMLQDQSTLIHGVGRVVWRRELDEETPENPSGMGIKFIKMDPESRSVVQRIVDDRELPGVFERGKDGVPSEPAAPGGARTKVAHVSEFLASALEEGGAGEAATQQAQAGVERSRQVSNQRAMSAFGGASVSTGGRRFSSVAPAMDELDAEDDFLDNETTKVQQLPTSEFPDAAATVIASETPFIAEKRETPVVPKQHTPVAPASASPLQEAVPDLFGPDSFGPAPGELIDASLLDPAVATVPPKASALPRGAVPDAPGIPSEAFKVPQAPAPVAAEPPRSSGESSRGWVVALLMVLLLAAAGVAAWQLGLTKDLEALASEYVGGSSEVPVAATPVPKPAPVEQAEVEPVAADAAEAPADADPSSAEGSAAADSAAEAPAEGNLVKVKVVTVPSGAYVSVNGKGAGRSPVTLEYEPGTKLSVYSKARGFLPRRQQVKVDARTREVKLVLAPLPWVVEVVSEPEGARASAVGGGQTTTPGELVFRSIPGSRKIVVSKDGYATTTTVVSRSGFVEEKTRMKASVRVRLAKSAAAAPEDTASAAPKADPPAAPEPAAEPPAAAAPEPAPAPAEEAPAPSEPAAAAP